MRFNIIKTKRIMVICSVLLAVLTLILLYNVTSSAHNTETVSTCYSEILINKGDTLTSIARDNYLPEYGSFNDYIDEIRSINHINNDMIHFGEYIVIPVCY